MSMMRALSRRGTERMGRQAVFATLGFLMFVAGFSAHHAQASCLECHCSFRYPDGTQAPSATVKSTDCAVACSAEGKAGTGTYAIVRTLRESECGGDDD